MTAISWAARVAALIDGVVDRAHRSWPAGYGVLHLPAGESVFVPGHRTDAPACPADHAGYYQTRIGPHCAANPIPRQRGTSELRPLVLDVFEHHVANGAAPVARYTVDLRTGEVFIELTLTKPEERVRSGIVG